MRLMKIDSRLIVIAGKETSADDVIDHLTDIAVQTGYADDLSLLRHHVRERERIAPTDFGNLIAIPHARSKAVVKEFIAFLKLEKPFIWNQRSVQLVFLIGVPETNADNIHLKMLATLSRHLIDDDFRDRLLNASDIKDVSLILEDLE